MKNRSRISCLLTVLGIVMALTTIAIVVAAQGASPVMVMGPDDAVQRAEDMMAAVCDGDYKAASQMMYGTPDLGAYPENANLATVLIWEAFLDSLEYETVGDCYVTDSGVSVDMRVKYLDVSEVIGSLDIYAEKLLNQRIEQAEDMADIYGEDNNYRQDMIESILQESVLMALEENNAYQEQTIPLHMLYEQGEWWVIPDSALLKVLAGSFSS